VFNSWYLLLFLEECCPGWIGIKLVFRYTIKDAMPVPVAARSKAQVCGSSSAEIVGSNPAVGMDVCLL